MLRHLLVTFAALTCVQAREMYKQARIDEKADANIVVEVSHGAGILKHTASGEEKLARVELESGDHSDSTAQVIGVIQNNEIGSIAKKSSAQRGEHSVQLKRGVSNVTVHSIGLEHALAVVVVLGATAVGYEIHRRKSDTDVSDYASVLSRSSTLLTVGGDLAQEAEEERKITGDVSTVASIMNLVTVMIGCGVLRFPQLVAECGWVLGGTTIVGAAFMNYLSCMALTRAIEHVAQKRPVNQYRDVVDTIFGPVGGVVTDVVFMSTIVAICAVYTTLLSDYSYALFGSIVLPRPAGSGSSVVPTRWTIGTGCVVALIAMLKDISFLSKLAVLGAISGGLYVVAIVGGGLTKAMSDDASVLAGGRFYAESFWPRNIPKTGVLATEPWRQSLGAADSFVTSIKAFSVMLFGYCCSDSLTSFRSAMRKPEELPAVLKLTHIIACAVYLAAGFAGFYGFGVEAKADILHSLCTHGECVAHPENRMIYYYILGGAVVMSVAVSLPFSFFVLFKTLENKITLVRENAAANSAARIALVTVVTATCVLVPSFTKLMDVMCDGLINMVVMIIPAACCLQIRRTSKDAMDLLGLSDIVLVTLGFLNAGIGLSQSVPALFEEKLSDASF